MGKWWRAQTIALRVTVIVVVVIVTGIVWAANQPADPTTSAKSAACEPEGRRFVEAWTAYVNGDGDEDAMTNALDDLRAVAPTSIRDAIDTVDEADPASVMKSDQQDASDAALILDGWLDDCGFALPS